MTEDAVTKAVADELAANFKPLQFRPTKAVPTPAAESQHDQWLRVGRQLHDQQVATVADLDRRYEALQGELVAKMRERDALSIDCAIEHARLASYRAKLGYGR